MVSIKELEKQVAAERQRLRERQKVKDLQGELKFLKSPTRRGFAKAASIIRRGTIAASKSIAARARAIAEQDRRITAEKRKVVRSKIAKPVRKQVVRRPKTETVIIPGVGEFQRIVKVKPTKRIIRKPKVKRRAKRKTSRRFDSPFMGTNDFGFG